MKYRYLILVTLLAVFITMSVRQYRQLQEQQKKENAEFIKKTMVLCGESIERNINNFEESVKFEFANRELEYFFDSNLEKLSFNLYNKYIFSDIKKIRRFYSSNQILISNITIYSPSYSRSFHRNNENYFTLSSPEKFKERVELDVVPAFSEVNGVFYYTQPITNSKGELIANARFTLNMNEFFLSYFNNFYIGKNNWSWVIYDGKILLNKYSEPVKKENFDTDVLPFFNEKLKGNLSASIQHTIHYNDDIDAFSVFYPVNILGKRFGIVFSINTETLYQQQNSANKNFFFFVLLAIVSIIFLFLFIIKQMRAAQNRLEMNQSELINARDESEKANKSKSEFLSRMSHELRTPLNAILGFSQLLHMGELNPGQRKGINYIMNSGKHLLDLINEVLDISRIESGNLSVFIESVCVNFVVVETIGISKHITKDRNIKIEFDQKEDFYVHADQQRLKQILINLVNNAVKYNKDDGTVRISMKYIDKADDKCFVRISVKDTGIGIKNEDIPKLFTPFERIGADKTQVEGTGLGLSVVKKLVELMEGTVGLESAPGTGSTFWVDLPCSKTKSELAENDNSNLFGNAEDLKKGGTILYIEDNTSNVELIEQILKTQRPKVKLVSNMYGGETIRLIGDHNPDLLLLDLNLPDIHGEDVLKDIKNNELTRSIPVVIVSADAMPHQLDRMRGAGAIDYLTKPIDVLRFLKIVDDFIS